MGAMGRSRFFRRRETSFWPGRHLRWGRLRSAAWVPWPGWVLRLPYFAPEKKALGSSGGNGGLSLPHFATEF
jgi:hypothetical protein